MPNIRKMVLKKLPELYEYDKLCNKLVVFLDNYDAQKPFSDVIHFTLTRKKRKTKAIIFWFKNLQSGKLLFVLKGRGVVLKFSLKKNKTNEQFVEWIKFRLKDLARN